MRMLNEKKTVYCTRVRTSHGPPPSEQPGLRVCQVSVLLKYYLFHEKLKVKIKTTFILLQVQYDLVVAANIELSLIEQSISAAEAHA